jgi:hypothetical protein
MNNWIPFYITFCNFTFHVVNEQVWENAKREYLNHYKDLRSIYTSTLSAKDYSINNIPRKPFFDFDPNGKDIALSYFFLSNGMNTTY